MKLARAQRLFRSGRFDEARRVLTTPQVLTDARQPIVFADLAAAQGLNEEARDVLERACQTRPGHAPTHLFLGIHALELGDAQAAHAAFEKVQALQPDNELAYSYAALALLFLGQEMDAIEIFRKRGFSDNRGFMVRLTEWVEGQWLEHDRFFSQRAVAPALEPGNRRGSMRRAEKAFFSHRYADVIRELGERDSDDARFACAISAEMLRDYEAALRHLEGISEVDDADAIIAARARCNLRLRKMQDAADALARVLIIGPEDYGTNYYLGVLCIHYDEPVRARKLFTRAYADYLVDTLEYQFWQIQNALLETLTAR